MQEVRHGEIGVGVDVPPQPPPGAAAQLRRRQQAAPHRLGAAEDATAEAIGTGRRHGHGGSVPERASVRAGVVHRLDHHCCTAPSTARESALDQW